MKYTKNGAVVQEKEYASNRQNINPQQSVKTKNGSKIDNINDMLSSNSDL